MSRDRINLPNHQSRVVSVGTGALGTNLVAGSRWAFDRSRGFKIFGGAVAKLIRQDQPHKRACIRRQGALPLLINSRFNSRWARRKICRAVGGNTVYEGK
jgi:hypothetical protein